MTQVWEEMMLDVVTKMEMHEVKELECSDTHAGIQHCLIVTKRPKRMVRVDVGHEAKICNEHRENDDEHCTLKA